MEPVANTIETRRKFVEAWNKTMLDIWQEKIFKYGIIDTGKLYSSPKSLAVRADGRFYDISLSQTFVEYGIWQNLGTGREFRPNNGGDLEFLDDDYRHEHGLDKPRRVGPKWGGKMTSGDPRKRRPWFSPKYYASVMNLRDFYAESLEQEFVGMFANLDAADLRKNTDYYRRKGLS